MTDTPEMRPCPFCGCSTTHGREGLGLRIFQPAASVVSWMAACLNCGTYYTGHETAAEALAAWNCRADDASEVVEKAGTTAPGGAA